MSKPISRRTQKRYKVKDGSFAVLYHHSSKLGQIIDISIAGFSFRYTDSPFIDNDRDGKAFFYHDHRQQFEDFTTFDIFLVDSGIYVNRIPCKVVSDFEIDEPGSSNSIFMKRCCIQFDELVPEQILDLADFIENCTVAAK